MTLVSKRQLLPTKPLLILHCLLSKSQGQSLDHRHRCGLSPFPESLSAKAPAATRVIPARGSCGEGAQPAPGWGTDGLLSSRTSRRDTGDTQGLLASFVHLTDSRRCLSAARALC